MDSKKKKLGPGPLHQAFNPSPEALGLSLHKQVNRRFDPFPLKKHSSHECNLKRALTLLEGGAVSVRKNALGLLPAGTRGGRKSPGGAFKTTAPKPNPSSLFSTDQSFFAGDTTLITAVRMLHDGPEGRDAILIRKMLEKGFDPNERNDAGLHPLTAALQGGNSRTIAALAEDPRTRLDPDIDARDNSTMIALKGAPFHVAQLRRQDMNAAADRLVQIVSGVAPDLFTASPTAKTRESRPPPTPFITSGV